MRKNIALWTLVAGCLMSSMSAQSAEPVVRQNELDLSASASAEVVKDWLVVTLNTTREGSNAAAVQSELKQALDAALNEAKTVAKPGQIEVHTGNFSLAPRYNNKGVANGWQGSAALIIEGRDVAGVAQLAGRINTLTIASVGSRLSREQREKAEGDLAAQAIARYRAKAADYAKQFGFAGYTIRNVAVRTNDAVPYMAQEFRKSAVASIESDQSLPVEMGNATVTVQVIGSVQMTK